MVLRICLLLITLGGILGLHVASIAPGHNWYNQFWWLDWVLHFAGGTWLAFLFLLFRPRSSAPMVIGFAFLIGFVWEGLEYMFNVPFFGVGEASFADSLWILDTLTDLFFDVVSAAIVAVIALRYTKSNV